MLIRALVVLEPASERRRLARLLESLDVLAVATGAPGGDGKDLLARVGSDTFDLLLVGADSLPDPLEGFFGALRRQPDRPEALVLRRGEDAEARAALLGAGALAVLDPDLADGALTEALSALVDRRRQTCQERLQGSAEPLARHGGLAELTARSPAMKRLVADARRVAATDATVFLLGETGSGKEWLARALHADSRRSQAPFLAVNCAALPETLLESELFGHERGAFTGAVRSRRGHFELAHGGTLFLDEIAEMSPVLQGKLLRALQERTIQRLGSERALEVDVRILAATSRDVEQAMQDGAFRADLYYRLAVITLTVPPLRERKEDLPLLAGHHLERIARRLGRPKPSLDDEALAALAAYPWPGNVRELSNVLERTVLLTPDCEITLEDLPMSFRVPHPSGGDGDELRLESPDRWLDRPLPEVLKEFHDAVERRYLEAQLAACEGKVGEAAKRAGIEPRSLYDRMKRHGLRKEDFRRG
jgi:DNA-binding NtrC family response regulator